MPCSSCLLQYDAMSLIIEAFMLPSNATRFRLYRFDCCADEVVSTAKVWRGNGLPPRLPATR